MKFRVVLLFALAACTSGPSRDGNSPIIRGIDARMSAEDLRAGPPADLSDVFSFAGAASAKASPSAVQISWLSAREPGTPSESLVYLIYEAASAGGQNFSTPTYTTSPGAYRYTVPKRQKSTTYYYVVRVRRAAGGTDDNRVEVSATTPDVADEQAPTFAGAAMAEAMNSTSVNLTWNTAVDNHAPEGEIVYLVYQANAAGAQNFVTPTYVSSAGATFYFASGLTPTTTYHFVVRALDLAGNREENRIEVSATTKAIAFGSEIVANIFLNRCLGGSCHSGRSPQEMLDLTTAAKAYAALVNAKSKRCGAQNLVAPGSADTSYLMSKVLGAGPCFVGSRMPPGVMPLTAFEITMIRGWINAGAPNN